jgi:5-enolpyruvylshikimate-3-phosphate synthase
MSRRPIADLVEGLRQLGVKVECETGCPPLTVHGGTLRGGVARMRGDRSSQYFSALLLAGVDVDMHDISDTVMTLAALAPLATGPTRIRNIANIRIKETDRLAAIATELQKLGQGVTQGPDFIVIEPRPITPALVHCYADHRMAMSFTVLGLAAGGVRIDDPACVAKTYPGFWDDVRACYASVSQPVPW